MPDNGEKKLDKVLQGIHYLIGDNKHLREEFWESVRQAAEDRKRFAEQAAEDRKRFAEQAAEDRKRYEEQAAEDRRQAAEDRRKTDILIEGIRKALVVIGKRGGEFVQIQKEQGVILRKVAEDVAEIRKAVKPGKNGNGPKSEK